MKRSPCEEARCWHSLLAAVLALAWTALACIPRTQPGTGRPDEGAGARSARAGWHNYFMIKHGSASTARSRSSTTSRYAGMRRCAALGHVPDDAIGSSSQREARATAARIHRSSAWQLLGRRTEEEIEDADRKTRRRWLLALLSSSRRRCSRKRDRSAASRRPGCRQPRGCDCRRADDQGRGHRAKRTARRPRRLRAGDATRASLRVGCTARRRRREREGGCNSIDDPLGWQRDLCAVSPTTAGLRSKACEMQGSSVSQRAMSRVSAC